MQLFLERYYENTHSDDVGALLGGMSVLRDGGTADPAAWEDWIEAVRQALASPRDDPRVPLDLKPPR